MRRSRHGAARLHVLVIAHAMQEYGMIVIDVAGHPKVYAEL